eukprot:scaffold315326_cov37-Tisochrysis_lutea.AAC.2
MTNSWPLRYIDVSKITYIVCLTRTGTAARGISLVTPMPICGASTLLDLPHRTEISIEGSQSLLLCRCALRVRAMQMLAGGKLPRVPQWSSRPLSHSRCTYGLLQM